MSFWNKPAKAIALLAYLALLATPTGAATGASELIWQGGLDPDVKAAVLAKHKNLAFTCDGVTLKVNEVNKATLSPSFSCTITVTNSKSTGITWEKRTYHLEFTAPFQTQPLGSFMVEQRLWSDWEYIERGQHHSKTSSPSTRHLKVTFKDSGSDKLMSTSNGVALLVGDIPWRLIGRAWNDENDTGAVIDTRPIGQGQGHTDNGSTGERQRDTDDDRSGNDDRTLPPIRLDDTPPPSSRRSLPLAGQGPYHEFAALCRMGWAAALADYSLGNADDSIVEHLRMAGEHMVMADQTTFAPVRAWTNAQGQANQLRQMSDQLLSRGDKYRRTLGVELQQKASVLANELAIQMAGGRFQRETCDSHYARLGFEMCYAQQAFQIAAAARRQDGQHAVNAGTQGSQHLTRARLEAHSLGNTLLATGSCIDLSEIEGMLQGIRLGGDPGQAVEPVNRAFQRTVELLGGTSTRRAVAAIFSAWTEPNPRRVGQSYTFTMAIDNPTDHAIRIDSVGAETWVDGKMQPGSGTAFFSVRSHAGNGWVNSVVQPGMYTIIYRGSAITGAKPTGEWRTRLVFHTSDGDFVVETRSRVIP